MKRARAGMVVTASACVLVSISPLFEKAVSAGIPGTAKQSTPPLAESWTPTDFTTATCGYIAQPLGVTFLLPPGFTTRKVCAIVASVWHSASLKRVFCIASSGSPNTWRCAT